MTLSFIERQNWIETSIIFEQYDIFQFEDLISYSVFSSFILKYVKSYLCVWHQYEFDHEIHE